MIKVFITQHCCGFMSVDEKSSEIIYGETCSLERLLVLLGLLSPRSKIELFLEDDKQLASIAQAPRSQDLVISSYHINHSLDVQKEFKLATMSSRFRKSKLLARRISLAAVFVLGITVGTIVGIPFVTDFYQSNSLTAAQQLDAIDSVTINAPSQINVSKLYSEIAFNYNPHEVTLLQVEDGVVECIFLSQTSGLKKIETPSLSDWTLTEGSAVTLEDTVYYFYTINGKLARGL